MLPKGRSQRRALQGIAAGAEPQTELAMRKLGHVAMAPVHLSSPARGSEKKQRL
jgi:hypothetical protein